MFYYKQLDAETGVVTGALSSNLPMSTSDSYLEITEEEYDAEIAALEAEQATEPDTEFDEFESEGDSE